MADERIISADSHVAIQDEAVLGHLPEKYHESFKAARLAYIAELAKRAKKKAGDQNLMPSQDQPCNLETRSHSTYI